MPVGLAYGDGQPLAAPRGISKPCQRYWARSTRTRIGRTGDQKRPESKVENQIARHYKLIVPSTVVVSFLIPGPLETQFRTQLDRCADPVTPGDRVL